MENLKKLAETLTERELAEIVRLKIEQLQRILAELSGSEAERPESPPKKRGPGRPRGSRNKKRTPPVGE